MAYKEPRNGEQSPIVEERASHGSGIETIVKHPAFGQIRVNRVSCGGAGVNLYDSDFGHNNYVAVEISTSQLHRDLSRDWHYEDKNIMRFAMSESQWATFVSSFGQGSGTPITFERMNGQMIPGIPAFDRTEVFKKEMGETMQEAVDGINQLASLVASSGLSKKKQEELLAGANKAMRALTSSIPFVQDQFDEHIETTTEKAYQEIHGYLNASISRAGIKALGGETLDVLQLGNSMDENNG